jgi:Tol biopolymer transport system component
LFLPLALLLVALAFAAPSASAPALARNGLIAFETATHGSEIYIRNADGTGVRRISDNRSASRGPVLSPDGKQVAFSHVLDDGASAVLTMGVDSRATVRLPTEGFAADPDWSPDGKTIVYATRGLDVGRTHLVLYDVATKRLAPLTPPGSDDAQPRWSPDGKRIAFVRVGRISIIGADGRNLLAGVHSGSSPSWSPDASRIVFDRQFRSSASDLWFIGANGRDARNVTNTPDVDEKEPSWGPRGIAYALVEQDPDHALGDEAPRSRIAIMQPDGQGPPTILPAVGRDRNPRWSRDGDSLVFTTDVNAVRGIAAVNGDGSGYRMLRGLPRRAAEVAWSPDGTQLAYALGTYGEGETYRIRVTRLDGRSKALSPRGAGDSEPAWSPDGRTLAFAHFPGREPWSYHVWAMRSDGKQRRPLTKAVYSDEDHPSWAPDGRRLVFGSDRDSAHAALYVVTSRTRTVRELRLALPVDASAAEPADGPSWSPRGDLIAFTYASDYGGVVYVVRPDGTGLRRVTPPGGWFSGPTWAPDGSRIVVVEAFPGNPDGGSALVTVRPDGSGFTRVGSAAWNASAPSWQPRP